MTTIILSAIITPRLQSCAEMPYWSQRSIFTASEMQVQAQRCSPSFPFIDLENDIHTLEAWVCKRASLASVVLLGNLLFSLPYPDPFLSSESGKGKPCIYLLKSLVLISRQALGKMLAKQRCNCLLLECLSTSLCGDQQLKILVKGTSTNVYLRQPESERKYLQSTYLVRV